MKKLFAPLKINDIVTLIVLIIIGFGWLLVDQLFLHETYQRFIAFAIVIMGLFFLQYQITKPEKLSQYINTIALITLAFSVVIGIVMHVIINHDFSTKTLLIWLISVAMPYISGFLYSKTTTK